MTEKTFIAAIDQGTTSTRFVIVDRRGRIVAGHQLEHQQIYPAPNRVEHDPMQIRDNTAAVIKGALEKTDIAADSIAAVGITNQRETTVVWDKESGRPVCNAIVWQDTRTDALCRDLAADGGDAWFREKTGLPPATYFSGPKIKWILDNVEDLAEAAEQGKLLFGNMDTWLTWWMTGGPGKGVHITDVTNASRTMLMSIKTLEWDTELLDRIGIPAVMLPGIQPSSRIYGHVDDAWGLVPGTPVAGILGDQQAALFGQACFEPGEAKNTYGTGCFLLANTGATITPSSHGLLTTVAYQIGDEAVVYALEGSIAMAGSLVQWLRDNIGLIASAPEIESLAETVADNGGVYFVPAFSGLFAPYWDSTARGLVIGLTHYANKGHLARAALEATAFQTTEIVEAMEKDSGIALTSLKTDGGMAANNMLLQFQADLLQIPVIRPVVNESTVLGAAYAAGLAVGFWQHTDEIRANWEIDREWTPAMAKNKRDDLYRNWKRAVNRSAGWQEI